jgi:crossover junction endodeoxyribonuclease RuvC
MNKKVRILGIDPALNNTGWAVVDENGSGNIEFVDIGHISNKVSDDYYCKLEKIRQNIEEIIIKYKPQFLSIEETFVNNNALSSLKLGVVRGVVLSVALQYNVKIMEFKPNEIKKTITGNGKAEKQQVDYMVKMLAPKAQPKTLDESDALAIALTGLFNL